jgi:cytochrome d ubiquinol oxidase subunit II
VAFANIFQGIPFDGDGIYHGTLLTLLNPYGLLGGVLFVLLFLQHGALWLAIKTDGALQARATRFAAMAWPVLVVVAVVPGRQLVCHHPVCQLPGPSGAVCGDCPHGRWPF